MSLPARQTVWIVLAPGRRLVCDGPALRIDTPGEPPRWVPWSRLAMLAFEGRGQLPTDVLLEAACRGVRVRLHGRGHAACELEPAESLVDSPDAQWDALLDRPGWRRSWRAFRLRQTLWAAARTIGRPLPLAVVLRLHRPAALAPWLGLPQAAVEHGLAALAAPFKLDARGLLRDAGWSMERLRRPRPGPDVLGHLRRQLGFEAVRLWRHGVPAQPLHWHAAHRDRLLARGRASLDGVLRWLADSTAEP